MSWAQGAEAAAAPGPPRSLSLSGGVAFDASVIDVSGRTSGGNGAEALVRASPSLTLTERGRRLQGSLLYGGTLASRRGIDDRKDTEYLNSLSASFVLEAIEGIGFVDARGSVTQQSISALGAPIGSADAGSNRTEVTTASVSPYLRSTLGGLVEVDLRALGAASRSNDGATPTSRLEQGSVSLRSPPGGGVLGWGLTGTRQRVRFGSSSATITDRAGAELTLKPDTDWRLLLSGGKERTDVVGAVQQTYDNYGAQVEWTPSPRTSVALQGEQRYFGRAHRVTVQHRLQRSVFSYADSRDVTNGTDALGQGQSVSLYQLLFAQFAAQIPDPVQRDQFVLAFIQALGRNRDDVVSGGLFGNAGISVRRQRDLSWTWTGPRLSLNATGFTVDSERADTGGFNPAGLNDNVAQSGYAASIGWRLTPQTSLNASGSRTMSKDTVSFARTDAKSASVGITSALGVRTVGALSARYSVFNGTADSYRETAITGSLSLRF